MNSNPGSRVIADANATYRLTDHACRQCGGGRVLERADGAGGFRCARCGARGDAVADVCWCGAMEMSAPVRIACARNPRPSAEVPAEIVLVEVSKPTTAHTATSPARPSAGTMIDLDDRE